MLKHCSLLFQTIAYNLLFSTHSVHGWLTLYASIMHLCKDALHLQTGWFGKQHGVYGGSPQTRYSYHLAEDIQCALKLAYKAGTVHL